MKLLHKHTRIGVGAIVVMSVLATGCGAAGNTTSNQTTTSSGGKTTLNETGSSLLYPLFNSQWIPAYSKKTTSVRLSPASTGSGTGISQALAGTVQIGASDAYLSNAQMAQTPKMLNIPLAISAQQIMYNLPGLAKAQHVRLNGSVIANIYQGKVTMWDDASIRALNPGLSLPHHAIIPVTRSDGSGDTFLFTQFLSAASSAWASSGLVGTTVSFPAVPGEVGSAGNSGVVQTLSSTPYSIGYVGISWLDPAVSKGLGYAALQNKTGQFVLPTPTNIQTAANAGSKTVPSDERISLIDEPGATAYPIVNYEYAIINAAQPSGIVQPLQDFLNWAIDPSGGNQSKYLTPVHFLPLPAAIESQSRKQIAKIGK
jgi:phosphate transport system substrate-binding protein